MKHRWIAIAAVAGMVMLGGCAPNEPGGAGNESASPSTAAQGTTPAPAPVDDGDTDYGY